MSREDALQHEGRQIRKLENQAVKAGTPRLQPTKLQERDRKPRESRQTETKPKKTGEKKGTRSEHTHQPQGGHI